MTEEVSNKRTSPLRPPYSYRACIGLIVLFLVLLALDQAIKYFADGYLAFGTSVPLIGGLIDLTRVHNTGAAFGMFQGGGWLLILVRALTSGALVYAMIRWRSELSAFIHIALTFILAGAIGNLVDQIAFGYVRDMFAFAFFDFPVFNMADACVTVGSAALFGYMVLTQKGRSVLNLLLGQKPAEDAKTESGNG